MRRIRSRNSKASDVKWIAPHMRASDLAELRACGRKPEEALWDGLNNSVVCRTIEYNGVPVAMYGVVLFQDGLASIWLLGTEEIPMYKLAFHRFCREQIQLLLRDYPRMINFVGEKNRCTIKWLRRLGAKFTRLVVPVQDGSRFIQFYFGRA